MHPTANSFRLLSSFSGLLMLVLSLPIPPGSAWAQTPDIWIHEPGPSGVNNVFLHGGVCKKFVFSYTALEWANAGLTPAIPYSIQSIWFRSNTPETVTYTDFKVQIGHSSLPAPVPDFLDNFDLSPPLICLDEPVYTLNFSPGPFAVVEEGWTRIDLTTAFVYNGTDNLVIFIELNSASYAIPLYGDLSTSSTWYTGSASAAAGSSNTWRSMFGISTTQEPPIASFEAEPDSICVGACLSAVSTSLGAPSTWEWFFPGSTSPALTGPVISSVCYDAPGTYSYFLVVSNANGRDTAFGSIEVLSAQTPDLGPDLSYCEGEQIELSPATPVDLPLWNTGQNSASITVSEPGWYWLLADGFCPGIDSVFLSSKPVPEPDLGEAYSVLCKGEELLLTAGPESWQYLWNTGSTEAQISVSESGTFTVLASLDGCEASASAEIDFQPCGCVVTVPNAFTPNNDGLNDRFKPVIDCAVERYRMQVWNRWGETVFLSDDPNLSWDGTYQGKIQELSSYIWRLEMTFSDKGRSRTRSSSGTMTLIP